ATGAGRRTGCTTKGGAGATEPLTQEEATMELKGKTAIITGSTRGIGAGIAVAFAREGANIVINGLTTESCNEMVKQMTDAGAQAMGISADVSKAADVEAMVAAT